MQLLVLFLLVLFNCESEFKGNDITEMQHGQHQKVNSLSY